MEQNVVRFQENDCHWYYPGCSDLLLQAVILSGYLYCIDFPL